jgi:enterochelin esterase-like enzyme
MFRSKSTCIKRPQASMKLIDIRFKSRYGNGNRRPRRVDRHRPLGGVLFLLSIVICLSACHTGDNSLPPPTPTILAPASPNITPTISATTTIPACYQQPGEMVEETLTSASIPRPLEVSIYLPPCYDASRSDPYPVLYLFHGLGDSNEQWPRLGVVDLADRLLMNRQVEPFLMVMPWEESGQDMVAAVLEVLIPHVESTYNTRTDRQGRAMGGISRGGGWALSIAAVAPEQFGAIGLHSPGVLSSFTYLQVRFSEAWSENPPRIWLDVGESDPLRTRALELIDLFDRLDLEYTWHLNHGGHEDVYWASHIDEYLAWYLQEWQ